MPNSKPMFHKGHTNRVAAAVGRTKCKRGEIQTAVNIAMSLADMFRSDNPEFSTEDFIVCFAEHFIETNTLGNLSFDTSPVVE